MSASLQFYAAADENDVPAARRILAAHPDLVASAVGFRGATLLHDMALEGKGEMIDLLLEHGADINSLAGGTTPLQAAVLEAPVATVELLLKRGANPHLVSKQGDTAMSVATASRHLVDEDYEHVVPDLLLRYGAELDLCSAVLLQRDLEMERLLATMTPAEKSARFARRALRFAALRQSIATVKSLLDHGVVPAVSPIEESALIDALRSRPLELEILRMLLQHPEVSKALSQTDRQALLDFATSVGHDEPVLDLIKAGAA
jgi:ankyrin repeat protein